LELINLNRITNAECILRDRKQRNEGTDLADCLQFCDKADIILKTENLMPALGFALKKEADQILERL
jgi:hypothetical protein